jgi:hypothetical protein
MRKTLLLILSLFCVSAEAQTTSVQPSYVSASVAFGSVGAGYTQFLAAGKPLVNIDILNNTDADIRCSWDAGTTSVEIPAYSSYSPDLGVNKKYIVAALQCKRDTGAPTVGSVEIFALY